MNPPPNPPILQWTEAFAIGIKALDFEHRDLFEHINRLLEDFAREDDLDEIETCLGKIHKRLQAHFALEEQVMKERKYPHFAEHKAEHEKFLDDFVEAMAAFEDDPGSAARRTLERDLRTWIVDHVMTSDKKMSAMTRPA